MGGLRLPQPRAFLNCARRLQVSSCQQDQNPYGPAQNPVLKTLCLQTGGGACPPPTPLLSFYAVPACFQEHRTMNKNWFKHIEVIDLFKNHHARSLFANGAATSPEAIWTLSEPVTCVCKWRGLRPPQPPSFFLRRAGLLSRTSHHQQDWLHAHNCYRAFQSHHAGSPFANCGAASAPTPALL